MAAYETQCGGGVELDYQGDNVKGCHQKPRESLGGCYITTSVCHVLGYSDDCNVLQELRNFREEVMHKNPKYASLLLEYDAIGPDLAYFIEREYSETKDLEMWTQIYNFYLNATANFVREKQYDSAVQRYQEMIVSLKEYFGIPMDYKPKIENHDYQKGGHDKVIVK